MPVSVVAGYGKYPSHRMCGMVVGSGCSEVEQAQQPGDSMRCSVRMAKRLGTAAHKRLVRLGCTL